MRQDYYSRAIAQLGRSLRAVNRYEKSFETATSEREAIEEARKRLHAAMKLLERANRMADGREPAKR